MPELPEVETVRRTLLPHLKGKEIKQVKIIYDNVINGDNHAFVAAIIGQTIHDIERKGKFLIFILDDINVISHLRMEGKYFLKNPSDRIVKHEHLIIDLSDDLSLRYHDTRKFGRLQLASQDTYLTVPPLSLVAGEPHETDALEFYQILQKKRVMIKVALLDQRLVAGLGNIYVDETLFLAKIHPERRTNDISLREVETILFYANQVLKEATFKGGTTIYSYTSSLGVDGLFQNELLVHTKEGMKCPNCHTIIEKIRVGGRGTYVCSNCQT